MKKSKLLIPLMIVLSLTGVSCGTASNSQSVFIVSVHDGDTFRDSDHNQYRLYGVDTPESSDQYSGFESTTGIEKIYSFEATELTKKLIEHKKVKIINETAKNSYGRKIARVISDGKDLSFELVKKGLARVAYIDVMPGSKYETKDYDFFRKILQLQRVAKSKKLGIWLHEDDFNIIFPKA